MPRYFNTTGPCEIERHYMLPPEQRLPNLLPFVEQELYFVVHSARQTGKSTAMRAFAERLRGLGWAALYASLEQSQGFEEVEGAEPLWLLALSWRASEQLPEIAAPAPQAYDSWRAGDRLRAWLNALCQAAAPKKVVLLLDEADTVSGPAMVSLLRQLRAGFTGRGVGAFPTSVALIGMRDLRDYLTKAKDGAPVNPGSPFNIKRASLTLRNFNAEEVGQLYQQHTDDTGQIFTPEAVERAFYWTQGQPFLANALAQISVEELVSDRSQAVTAAHIDTAKEQLILSRTTHLDSLAERLKEERVARILQPILLGDVAFSIPYDHDDYQYILDLGLIRKGMEGAEPANPLYREVLARQLGYNIQEGMSRPWWKWLTPEESLDFPALVDAFLEWWRENEGAIYAHGNKQYPEALPHLSFMAFLQRVINGGGQVHREYAADRKAIDLVIVYGKDRFVVELKRVFPGGKDFEKVREDGAKQLANYLDITGEEEGWLLLFDQRKGRTWDQRLWREDHTVGDKTLHLCGA